MQKKKNRVKNSPRYMTECDVIRYNLKMPETMKKKLKKEPQKKDIDMSSYICAILSGDIKRSKV
jgi:hypothetical protein